MKLPSTKYSENRVPSAVHTSSPSVVNCTISSWASRTSEVENPDAGSVNSASSTGAGDGAGAGADGAAAAGADGIDRVDGVEGEREPQPTSPWASTAWASTRRTVPASVSRRPTMTSPPWAWMCRQVWSVIEKMALARPSRKDQSG